MHLIWVRQHRIQIGVRLQGEFNVRGKAPGEPAFEILQQRVEIDRGISSFTLARNRQELLNRGGATVDGRFDDL